jgi:hypothetical protein
MLDWILKNKDWLFSGVGVVIATSIIALFKRRNSLTPHQLVEGPPEPKPLSAPVMSVSPMGLSDSSVVARLNAKVWKKRFSLQVGDYCEFDFTIIQRVRIGFETLVEGGKGSVTCAKISINSIGLVSCGHDVKAEGYQTFLVPQGSGRTSECILSASVDTDQASLFMIWVNHIHARRESIELDVVTLRASTSK